MYCDIEDIPVHVDLHIHLSAGYWSIHSPRRGRRQYGLAPYTIYGSNAGCGHRYLDNDPVFRTRQPIVLRGQCQRFRVPIAIREQPAAMYIEHSLEENYQQNYRSCITLGRFINDGTRNVPTQTWVFRRIRLRPRFISGNYFLDTIMTLRSRIGQPQRRMERSFQCTTNTSAEIVTKN